VSEIGASALVISLQDTSTHIGNVVPRQEYLSDGLSKLRKEVVPEGDQSALTDSSNGLYSRQPLGSFGIQVHSSDAYSNSPRRNNDHLVSRQDKLMASLDDG